MNEKSSLRTIGQAVAEEAKGSLDKDLTISNCYMFAKVMSEEPLCREMLQRILGVQIRKIEYIEPEKTVLKSFADSLTMWPEEKSKPMSSSRLSTILLL